MWLYWMSSSNYSNEESYLLYLYSNDAKKMFPFVSVSNTGDFLGPDDVTDVRRTYMQRLKKEDPV